VHTGAQDANSQQQKQRVRIEVNPPEQFNLVRVADQDDGQQNYRCNNATDRLQADGIRFLGNLPCGQHEEQKHNRHSQRSQGGPTHGSAAGLNNH